MITRILTIKEWKFNKEALVKLEKFFATAGDKISIRRKILIERQYEKLLASGMFRDKIDETISGIDRAIESWEKYNKKNKS